MAALLAWPTVASAQFSVSTQGGRIVADYFQLRTINTGAPPSGDCDAAAETGRIYIDSTNDAMYFCSGASGWVAVSGSSVAAGAPTDATYITQTAHGDLSAEQALGALATGILKSTTTTGVLSIAVGADIPRAGSDGQVQFGASGVLAGDSGLAFNSGTDSLGVIGGVVVGQTSTGTGTVSFNGVTSGTAVLTSADAAGTPTLTLPTASGTLARTADKLSAFAATTSAELAGVLSNETGTGSVVLSDSPVFTTNLTIPLIISAGNDNIELNPGGTGKMKFVGQYYSPMVPHAAAGATETIDWNEGNEHRVILDENVTFTFSNPVDGGRYVVGLVQDGTGGNAVTWPSGAVLWTGGAAPTITTTAGAVSLCTFMYDGTLSKYWGACNLDMR